MICPHWPPHDLHRRQRLQNCNAAYSYVNMTYTVSDRGKLDKATAMQQEVLKRQQCMLSNEHLETILATSNLAVTLSNQGKVDEVAAGQQEVLEMQQLEHPWRRAPKHDHIHDKDEYDEDFYRGGEGI